MTIKLNSGLQMSEILRQATDYTLVFLILQNKKNWQATEHQRKWEMWKQLYTNQYINNVLTLIYTSTSKDTFTEVNEDPPFSLSRGQRWQNQEVGGLISCWPPALTIMALVFQTTIKPPLKQLYNKDRGGLVYLIRS